MPQGSILGPLLFTIFFNDVDDILQARILKYADDTVIYYSNDDFYIIKNSLKEELERLEKYFYGNELIINVKKGKTESMIFGTSKRLSKHPKSLESVYNQKPINHVTSYTCLGCQLDPNLQMHNFFDRRYKKASSRIKLLFKMRPYLTIDACQKIYDMMIIPIITYCSTVSLLLTQSKQNKLLSIRRRASEIMDGENLPLIEKIIKRDACMIVKKSLNKELCEQFDEYFTIIEHGTRTRNNGKIIALPQSKTRNSQQIILLYGCKVV